MNSFKKFVYSLLALVIVVGILYVVERNYSYIFSRDVSGEIIDVQRVNSNLAVVGGNAATNDSALFSFAVAVRDEKGVIHTASTEDRQWAIAKPGFCVDAVFYPYPPWDLNSAGTYQNARLIHLRDCPQKTGAGGAPAAAGGASSAGAAAAAPGTDAGAGGAVGTAAAGSAAGTAGAGSPGANGNAGATGAAGATSANAPGAAVENANGANTGGTGVNGAAAGTSAGAAANGAGPVKAGATETGAAKK